VLFFIKLCLSQHYIADITRKNNRKHVGDLPPAFTQSTFTSQVLSMPSKVKKIIGYSTAVILGILLIGFIALWLKFQAVTELVLHRFGFPDATVGKAEISFSGTRFENIRLQKNDMQVEIGKLSLFATWDDILSYRLGEVMVDGLHAIVPATTNNDAAKTPTDYRIALPRPLNLRARVVDLKNIRVFVPGPIGDMKITISGNMLDRGTDYQAALDIEAETAETARFAGKITATAEKTTGKAAANIELTEGRLKAEAPNVDIKRLLGWVRAEVVPGQDIPVIKSQLSAGAFRAYGIPLEGVTLTADIDAAKINVTLQGQAMNGTGDVLADIKLDRADAALDKLAVTLDSKLKNLDVFNIDGLRGQGSLALKISGDKARDADWVTWNTLGGTANVNAAKLSLPGLLKQAEAAAKMKLSYNPAQKALGALLTDTMTFKGIVIPVDAAKPIAVTLPAAKEKAGIAYDAGSGLMGLRFKNMDVSAPLFALTGAEADIKLNLNASTLSQLSGTFEIAQISSTAKPAYLLPLKMTGRLDSLKNNPGQTRLKAELTEKNGRFYATLDGFHDLVRHSGNVTLNIPPMTLRKGILSLADISPASGAYVKEVAGIIGVSADAKWSKPKKEWALSTGGQIFLKDIEGNMDGNIIQGVNAVLNLDSLLPLSLTQQRIAVGAVNVGLPLGSGLVVASLDAQKNFTLHEAEWKLAGGTISSSPLTVKLDGALTADATLTAKNLQLADLFQIAPLDGLSAEGTVDGVLPLEIRNGEVSLKNAVLESRSSGKIMYSPQEIPAFLRDSSQQIVDLRVALKAFAFESLKLTIDGTLGKGQKVGLSAKGKNPEFYDGYPVNINLNVEGPLENILKYAPGSNQIPDTIQKQLEEYEKKHDKK